jgi:Tol biopolymer transport system component
LFRVDLTNRAAYDGEAHGRRDGERIVFSSDRAGDEDIWVMNADRSGPVRLTNTPAAFEGGPSWPGE